MNLNYVGSNWSHRFVTACLPKMFKNEAAFQEILTFIKNDAVDLLYNGVSDSDGNMYRIAVLQCCGDWHLVVKTGKLARSFSSVEKPPRGPDLPLLSCRTLEHTFRGFLNQFCVDARAVCKGRHAICDHAYTS